MAVRLSKRLTALAALVTEGSRLADVGTDHGYIPIYLVMEGKVPSAIAMDINEGPLKRAAEHIAEYGLGDKIQIRLSDGVNKLNPGEADTILIAGMGGGLVQKILSEGAQVLAHVNELVLQPQSEIMQVRRFLRENGFLIVKEDMIEEDGKYYPMMKVHKLQSESAQTETDKMRGRNIDPFLADSFGPLLLADRHPVLLEWLNREKDITEKILAQLGQQTENAQIIQRKQELCEKQKALADAVALMK